jgi:hypothetical protein
MLYWFPFLFVDQRLVTYTDTDTAAAGVCRLRYMAKNTANSQHSHCNMTTGIVPNHTSPSPMQLISCSFGNRKPIYEYFINFMYYFTVSLFSQLQSVSQWLLHPGVLSTFAAAITSTETRYATSKQAQATPSTSLTHTPTELASIWTPMQYCYTGRPTTACKEKGTTSTSLS